MSSEVSALMICLITLDRFIVLRFPFSQVRFRRRSAITACCIAWFTGACVALIPLTPPVQHWHFYGQNGICLPLPITRPDVMGKKYAFAIMICLNFCLFIAIAVGQVAIFWTVRSTAMDKSCSNKHTSDLRLAYRLASIVVSDFVCWFPIGVLGLVSAQGVVIPSEVNVAVAILVLPLNSALNPFLYTLNTLLEMQRARKMDRLTSIIEARIKAEMMGKQCSCTKSRTIANIQ